MNNKYEIKHCPECEGRGWNVGSEAGHGCDGSYENCCIVCPIQVQIQVGCEYCGGKGELDINKCK